MSGQERRTCVICGVAFYAYPSQCKTTCSPACRSARAALAARKGRKWSEEARRRRAEDSAVQAQMRELQEIGARAALSLPQGQRGPQNRASKAWRLIDPGGNVVETVNLLHWARENYRQFEPDAKGPEKAANRIASGFRAIASSMRGAPSRRRPVSTYKGWGLLAAPEK